MYPTVSAPTVDPVRVTSNVPVFGSPPLSAALASVAKMLTEGSLSAIVIRAVVRDGFLE